jgi:hypothetical protein
VPEWKRRGHYTPIDVPVCPVQADIAAYEKQLNDLLLVKAGPTTLPAYPLTAKGTPQEMGMHAELKDSWDAHHSQPVLQGVKPDTEQVIKRMQVRAVQLLPFLDSFQPIVWVTLQLSYAT